jgi:hypothetical protein
MENIKQSQQLLEELDALIQKDYFEALLLIENFKKETELLREHNSLSEQDVLDISKDLDIFEKHYS